jgi:hypothetical protein
MILRFFREDKRHMRAMTRSLTLAVIFSAAPFVAVLAQGTGSAAGTAPPYQGSQASNPHSPGSTGDAVVKGDKSTISGDHRATKEDQKAGSSGSSNGSD